MENTADQYRIIAESAAWIDRRDRGLLRFEGRDVSSFLQGLLTNDVLALEAGRGLYATYLSPQGRMIADLRLHQAGDHALAQVPADTAKSLAARFDQLIFTEDVRVVDVSASVAQVSVVGSQAADVIVRAAGEETVRRDELMTLPPLGHVVLAGFSVARSDEVVVPAYNLLLGAPDRASFIERLEAAGAAEAPLSLLEALRIEAGRPAYGIDMGEDTIPLEAGLLERAVSTTKGCYVGQEVIIRVLHRGGGRVARRLVKLRFDPGLDAPPKPGTSLTYEDRDVGRITSAAVSPSRGGVVALGYVRREQAVPGIRVALAREAGGHAAEIIGLAG
jgi:folate-binding protein YgfZ